MIDAWDVIVRPVVTLLLAVARVVLFLAWDLAIHVVAWSVGWCVCRVCTFGRYPPEGVTEFDHAPIGREFFVGAIGVVSLIALVAWLANLAA